MSQEHVALVKIQHQMFISWPPTLQFQGQANLLPTLGGQIWHKCAIGITSYTTIKYDK